MKSNLLYSALLVLLLMAGQATLLAQEAPAEDHSYKPLTLKLNDTGSKYVRFIIWHQQWLETSNLAKPDGGEVAKLQLNTSIRRSRMLAYAQISSRFLILTHFGLNSLNTGNLSSLGNNGDAPQLFLHDAWAEFKVSEKLYIGSGLHYWKGLTRMASQGTLNFMTLDQSRPFVGWHSLGVSDQFARHLGVYAKGEIGKFDYRLAINNPLKNNLSANYSNKPSGFTYTGVVNPDKNGDATGNTVVEGYFRYQLKDKEATKLPFNVGTYLGTKDVLSIGAGFFAHPNGMFNTETGEHGSVTHFAADIYLDKPIKGGGCLNAYLAFQSFNYGENYVSRWAGTGTNIYGQVGYLIPGTKIMPYVAYQTGNYDGVADPVNALDIGANYFINGHNAKLTLEYHQSKELTAPTVDISQIRLQAHVFL